MTDTLAVATSGTLIGPGGVMTPLQAVLFALGIAMVLVWFYVVSRLSRRLRERHEQKYDELGLEYLWPQSLGDWLRGYNNARPAMALLRFLQFAQVFFLIKHRDNDRKVGRHRGMIIPRRSDIRRRPLEQI